MNSDTSSDLNINFMGDNLNVLKKDTSETDYYLGLIANPSKTLINEPNSSSSLELSETDKEENASSSSKPVFEDIKIPKLSEVERVSSKHSVKSSEDKFSFSDINRSERRRSERRGSERRRSERITHDNSEDFKPTPPVRLTAQEIRRQKIDMLRKLSELKLRGYKLSREYDFNSSLEEMEYEYDMLKSFADKRNGIKLYKNLILNGCSVIEFFNDKYDPFSFKLSGWSEHMNVEVDNYDDVLEELYEKYRGSGGSMPPELKLLLLVLASASAFHFSKSFESKIPGLNKMYTNNAGVIPGMFNGNQQQSQFMSEQELNIQRQREEMIQAEKQRKAQMRQQHMEQQNMAQARTAQPQPPSINQNPMFQNRPNENYQNTFHPVGQQNTQSRQPVQQPSRQPVRQPVRQQGTPSIKKSEDVNDILKRLHQNDGTEEESSVNNDRILSDTTISEGGTRRRKKKSMMVIT